MTINHIGLSSGKDSTALWGWAINDSGYSIESIRGSFCDTENEYQEVYDQIKTLDEYGQKHGVAPVVTLRANDKRWTDSEHPLFLALALWKQRFPSSQARFCTEFLKVVPTLQYFESLKSEGHEVIAHSGVRRDESTERSALDEYGERNGFKIRRPLLDWSIEAVWAAHRRFGLPVNPLYFTGRRRVGCKLCCMSNKEDVRATKRNKPETIPLYRSWELMFPSGFQSFFPAGAIPSSTCSRETKTKDGRIVRVPTIDDVAAWSMTLHGGKQQGFDFMFEEDDSHLPCQSGYCE